MAKAMERIAKFKRTIKTLHDVIEMTEIVSKAMMERFPSNPNERNWHEEMFDLVTASKEMKTATLIDWLFILDFHESFNEYLTRMLFEVLKFDRELYVRLNTLMNRD